jgi:hypothetical protein
MSLADEALKSLVTRFKDAPANAFTDLAATLLARGHAAEALRIAEHGLQIVPASVDGRIERAAALLALGRPRVAYVELKRALAINPTNRRAMRLLGKVYVDAGAPSRAAELLAQRFKAEEEEQETTHVSQSPFAAEPVTEAVQMSAPPLPTPSITARSDTEPLKRREALVEVKGLDRPPSEKAPTKSERPAIERAQPPQLEKKPATKHSPTDRTDRVIPDLFADLTRDLGLSDSSPETPVKRVEVTQVIRRRGAPRPRTPSELLEIDGPIVDTTQPGKLQEVSTDLVPPSHPDPAPLFDAVTSPRLQLAPFGLDDEPLFQENMPFAVRPVEAEADPLNDLRETIDEEMPEELDRAFRNAIEGGTPKISPGAAGDFNNPSDTVVDKVEDAGGPRATPPVLIPRDITDKQPRDRKTEPADQMRFEGSMPLLELSRPARKTAQAPAPKLELVVPKTNPSHIALAVMGAIAMAIFLIVLLVEMPAAWRPGFMDKDDASPGHTVSSEHGSAPEGQELSRTR